MYRNLVPFRELIRTGEIPAFRVSRVALVTEGVEIAAGEVIAPDTFGRVRLRQLYEQRRIEPVVAPPNSRQKAILAQARSQPQGRSAQTSVADSASGSDLILSAEPIPVAEEAEAEPAHESVLRQPSSSGPSSDRRFSKPLPRGQRGH